MNLIYTRLRKDNYMILKGYFDFNGKMLLCFDIFVNC